MSSYVLTTRILPLPPGGRLALRLVRRNLVVTRRSWILIVSGFFEPVFYLLGLGVGVGSLIGKVHFGGGLVPYREFAAPALLAASAMNGAVYESTSNVYAKLKFTRTYEGVLATPLGVRDIAVGELTYALMRGMVYACGFMVVMSALGYARSLWALAAIPGALLLGAAFGSAGLVAVTFMRSWADFGVIEVVTLPLFLFSATFVPLGSYPRVVQWLLPATPLYHGVALLRGFTLGQVGPALLVHAGYLVALTVLCLLVADRRLGRLLLK